MAVGSLVSIEAPDTAEARELIAELDAYQDTLYPAEARYTLGIAALMPPQAVFAMARNAAGQALGCGAIVLNEGYGEVKRMYLRPQTRGMGVASQIMDALESAAQARGCHRFLLETGPYQPAALAFYSKHGYVRCGAFGAYPEHPLSVFMGKVVAPAPSTERA